MFLHGFLQLFQPMGGGGGEFVIPFIYQPYIFV